MKPWAERFYNSDAWRSCRDSFLKSKGYLCERCSTPDDPVTAKIAHHKTYLGVEANDNGLFTFADLSKSRAAQDMFEEIKNGLVTKMSWAFRVSEDSYDRDTRTRTILKIAKVYDVSAVSIPANADTDISARSYFDGVIEREQQERLERRKKLLKIKLMTEV